MLGESTEYNFNLGIKLNIGKCLTTEHWPIKFSLDFRGRWQRIGIADNMKSMGHWSMEQWAHTLHGTKMSYSKNHVNHLFLSMLLNKYQDTYKTPLRMGVLSA